MEKMIPAPRKMRQLFLTLVAFVLIFHVLQLFGNDYLKSDFDQANQLYLDNDFQGAIEHYTKILNAGYSSGELYYNLGNAYFKNGRLGLAILHYEKAKKLLPHDQDLLDNLEMVRLRVADRIEVPRLAFWSHVDSVRDYLTLNALAKWSLLFYLLTLVLAAVYYVLPKGGWKKITFLSAGFLLAVFLLFGSVFSWRLWIDKNVREGVILAEKVEIFSAPDAGSQGLFSLHEGVKVQITQEFDQWKQISLPDSKRGWMPEQAIAEI